MRAPSPRYSKEEFARRGDEIYDRQVSPNVGSEDEGKFAVIDIETGAYEIDQDELAASDRLLARVLDAQIWTRRVGSRYARRIGCRSGVVRWLALAVVAGGGVASRYRQERRRWQPGNGGQQVRQGAA